MYEHRWRWTVTGFGSATPIGELLDLGGHEISDEWRAEVDRTVPAY
ncbi:MAG: hypothetical protein R2939_07925 [Kofleriaceae bacterium]